MVKPMHKIHREKRTQVTLGASCRSEYYWGFCHSQRCHELLSTLLTASIKDEHKRAK